MNGIKVLIAKYNVTHEKTNFAYKLCHNSKKISPYSAIYEVTFKLTFASTIARFLFLTVQVLNLKKQSKIEQFKPGWGGG